MSFLYGGIVAIALALCLVVQVQAYPELVNGDFEVGLEGWELSECCSVDSLVKKSGASSVRLSVPVDVQTWRQIVQSLDVAPNEKYQLSVWTKLENVKQTHFALQWVDSQGQGVRKDYLFTGSDGTRDWVETSGTFTAPENAARVQLIYYAGWSLDGVNAALSWLDSVSWKPLATTIKMGANQWTDLVRTKYGESMAASEMREKVLYYDEGYESGWVKGLENIVLFFKSRGFDIKNADNLRSWMLEKVKNGADGTVCILSMGIVPDTIAESIDHDCTLRRYLNAGGRVLWIGDIPLFYRSYAVKPYNMWGGEHTNPRTDVLDIRDGARNLLENRSEITATGKIWGMQVNDSPVRTFVKEDITLAFTDVVDTEYVSSFFKCYNEEFPYGGFLRFYDGEYNGENDDLNATMYRLALFRGKPIEVPAVEKNLESVKLVPLQIITELNNYYRGQDVPVRLKMADEVKGDALKLVMLDGNTVVREYSASFEPQHLFIVDTNNLASKEYTLNAIVSNKNNEVAAAQSSIYLAPRKTPKVYMGVYAVSSTSTERRTKLVLEDLRDHLGECGVITGGGERLFDEALRYGLGIMPVSHAFYDSMVSKTQNPELAMRISDGSLPKYHFGTMSQAPSCVANPVNRERINKRFKEEIEHVHIYPSFIKRMYVSDDVAMFGEPEEHLLVCYCDYCKGEFKKLTGHDAPLAPAESVMKSKGVVEDNDPWYLWMKYRSLSAYGDWNSSMNAAKNEIDPEIKFGPEHSGGSSPVFNPQWALNPPDDYGGMGIVSFYYYPQLQIPVISVLRQMELAVMGNRDKELWVTPQGSDYAHLINNDRLHSALITSQFYTLLAGGITGLTWFAYPDMPGTQAWESVKPLSQITTKYGALLRGLKRKTPQVGVLASWANASYQWSAGAAGKDLYLPLLNAHIPAQYVADEEILQDALSKYKVLALADVDFLTRSVYDKIRSYIENDGKVFVDENSEIDIPGSVRVNFEDMSQEIAQDITRDFDIDNPQIAATVFTDGSATYLMLLNKQMEQEAKGKITLDALNDSFAFDVFNGKQIDSEAGILDITIQAAGGMLVGLYPSKPANVVLKTSGSVARGSSANIKVQIVDIDSHPVHAALPVKITIKDPDGKETEYSDYYSATSGMLDFSFIPAANDTAGTWTVEALELSTNTKSAALLEVE